MIIILSGNQTLHETRGDSMMIAGLVINLQPVPVPAWERDLVFLVCTLIFGTFALAAMICLMVSRFVEPLPTER